MAQDEEDLDNCPPLESEILPDALIFRRDRLPRPPNLVYGFPLDLAKFADHVDKVCAELNLPAPNPTKSIVGRAMRGMLLFQSHLKRIPRAMVVPVHGPDSHVMFFTYNLPTYKKWDKGAFKKMEKYMVENGIMEGPLKLKWYMEYDSQWELA